MAQPFFEKMPLYCGPPLLVGKPLAVELAERPLHLPRQTDALNRVEFPDRLKANGVALAPATILALNSEFATLGSKFLAGSPGRLGFRSISLRRSSRATLIHRPTVRRRDNMSLPSVFVFARHLVWLPFLTYVRTVKTCD